MPAAQSVNFGATTKAGYGGHKLGYTGAGTLTIAGTNANHWVINAVREMVPAGVYGEESTFALVGPYNLTASADGMSWPVKVTILPGRSTVRNLGKITQPLKDCLNMQVGQHVIKLVAAGVGGMTGSQTLLIDEDYPRAIVTDSDTIFNDRFHFPTMFTSVITATGTLTFESETKF